MTHNRCDNCCWLLKIALTWMQKSIILPFNLFTNNLLFLNINIVIVYCFCMAIDSWRNVVPETSVTSPRFCCRLAFIYYMQGQAYFDTQQYVEALESYAKSAEIKPDNDSYHTRRLVLLNQQLKY